MYGVSMKYMRPPEGEYSERVLAVAKDMGYRTILWSFAYKDWDINMQQGADYAFNQVTPYLHDGAVLLLTRSVLRQCKCFGRYNKLRKK